MKQILGFALFFTIFFGMYGGAHYYLYRRLVFAVNPPPTVLLALRLAFLLLVLAFPLMRVLSRFTINCGGGLGYVANLLTAVWMGLSTLKAEIAAGHIDLSGDKAIARSMHSWLGLSPFAKEKRRVAS